MVDLLAVGAGNAIRIQGLAYGPGEGSQRFDITEPYFPARSFNKKKPVSSPGNIATHLAESRHFDGYLGSAAVARDIVDGYFAVGVEDRADSSNRSFHPVFPGRNAPHVRKSSDEPNRPVTAHPEISDVVKKNYPRRTCRIDRFTKQRAHHDIGTSWFVHYRGTKGVVFAAKTFQSGRQRPLSQVRATADNQSRRLAAGMRINHSDSSGVAGLHEWLECSLSSIILNSYELVLVCYQ